MRPARVLSTLLAVLVCASCAQPQIVDAGPTDVRRTEQAARPEPIRPDDVIALPTTPSDAPPSDASTTAPPPTGDASAGTPSPPPADGPSPTVRATPGSQPAFRQLVAIQDNAGDQGLEGPAHADLRSVTLADDGTSLRVTVVFAGEVPQRLADGETMGIGVDLFGDAQARESDHQLFADGGADGWFAYLQGPDGFVDYPGSFRLGGDRIVFQVPWTALGNRPAGEVSVFIDWSQTRTLLNAASSDRAPNAGRSAFRR